MGIEAILVESNIQLTVRSRIACFSEMSAFNTINTSSTTSFQNICKQTRELSSIAYDAMHMLFSPSRNTNILDNLYRAR